MELKIRGAIFDLDGTLLDSMGVWTEVDHVFLRKRGLPYDRGYIDVVKKLPHKQSAVFAKEYFNLTDEPADIIAEWHQTAIGAYETTIALKAGALEYLSHLRASGVKIAAATSSLPEHAPAALKRLGVYNLIENFTYTAEAARPKGFSDVYELAAKRLGLRPCDCAVFEDLPEGVAAAKAGGFVTVGVFDEFYADGWDGICTVADIAIKDFTELSGVKL